MDNEAERHEKIAKLYDILRSETNENADGLYELIERFATGNPRLNKRERKTFNLFIHAIIGNNADLVMAMERFRGLWQQQVTLVNLLKKSNELLDERIDLLSEQIKRLRRDFD